MLVLAVVTACSSSQPAQHSRAPVSERTIRLLDLKPCPSNEMAGFDCGRLTVPLDHAHPGGAKLRLPVAGTGWLYPVAAVLLGALFLAEAHLMWARARGSNELTVVKPMRVFHWSNMYLSLLFVAVAIDPLLTR